MALNLPDLGAKLWLLLTESPDVLHSERSPILDYSIIKLSAWSLDHNTIGHPISARFCSGPVHIIRIAMWCSKLVRDD
jgi:hypothetical protein